VRLESRFPLPEPPRESQCDEWILLQQGQNPLNEEIRLHERTVEIEHQRCPVVPAKFVVLPHAAKDMTPTRIEATECICFSGHQGRSGQFTQAHRKDAVLREALRDEPSLRSVELPHSTHGLRRR
jgi:hypothetical protein